MYSEEDKSTCKEPAPGPDSGFLSGAISTEQTTSEYDVKPYSRLDSGLDLSAPTTGDSPLHTAILQYTSNLSNIKQLLDSTPSLVNELNECSQTPLHYSCMVGEYSITQLLLQYGAVSVQDDEGNTPLHYAVKSNDGESVQLLLEQMDTPDVYNFGGLTPLHLSTTSPTLLSLLLGYCDPNVRELKAGQSTLHIAIEKGHLAAVKLLIKSGASLVLENYSDLNAYEYAVERREYGIAGEILKAGGGGWVREDDESESEEEEEVINMPVPVTACS